MENWICRNRPFTKKGLFSNKTFAKLLMKKLPFFKKNFVNFEDLFKICTVWKVSRYGVFSGPYFPVFEKNTEIYLLRKSPYSVRIQENKDQKKLRIWILFTQWLIPNFSINVPVTWIKVSCHYFLFSKKRLFVF